MKTFVIVLGAAIIIFALWQSGVLTTSGSGGAYQAVFLTNDQVYFGKVRNETAQYVSLSDIYYLQVTQQLQPASGAPAQRLDLIKLGNELHGPTDEMRINRDQVLFIEDLKDDSQVVQAIENFREQEKGASPTPTE